MDPILLILLGEMKTGFRLLSALVFVALILGAGARAHAQVLVVEMSDNHSAYDQLPGFLRAFDRLKADYLSRHSDGQVVVLVNGDFGGLSSWADDRGWIGMQTLRALAAEAATLYELGNHDGFDWGAGGRGNELVHNQLKFLSESGVHVLGSGNIEFSPETARFVSDHFDLVTASGRKTRFVGLGLEIFFSRSAWDPGSRRAVLSGVRPPATAMIAAGERAIADGTRDLVFFQHDGHARVAGFLREMQEKLGARLASAGVGMPVAFAAHDHLEHREQIGGTWLVDSRSNFDFSAVEIGADGAVQSARFFDRAAREALARESGGWRSPRLEELANGVERKLARRLRETAEVLGRTEGFGEIKTDLKNGRIALGTALAESLRAWAEDRAPELAAKGQLPTGLKIVSFYNSSSYRRDEPIPRGDVTRGLIEGLYPFPGETNIFLATGAEIQELFQTLRDWREKDDGRYTPQLSRNLQEADGGHRLLIGERGEAPVAIDPSTRYVLVLDSWLSRDGYHLPVFKKFLESHAKLATTDQTKLLASYLPKVMAEPLRYRAPLTCSEIFR